MSFLSSRIPSKIHFISLHVPLDSWLWCFLRWPRQLLRILVGLQFGCVQYFLSRLFWSFGFGGGRLSTMVKWYYHHIISRAHNINIAYLCWCSPWLPGWDSVVNIIYYIHSFTSFTLYYLKQSVHNPHVRSVKLCSTFVRAEYFYKFFCMGDLLFLCLCL